MALTHRLVPFPVTAREGRPTDSHSSRVDLAAEGCARLPQGELDHLAFVRLPCFLARPPYSLQSGASAQAVRRARLRENLCRRCERKRAVAGGRAEESSRDCVRACTDTREGVLLACAGHSDSDAGDGCGGGGRISVANRECRPLGASRSDGCQVSCRYVAGQMHGARYGCIIIAGMCAT